MVNLANRIIQWLSETYRMYEHKYESFSMRCTAQIRYNCYLKNNIFNKYSDSIVYDQHRWDLPVGSRIVYIRTASALTRPITRALEEQQKWQTVSEIYINDAVNLSLFLYISVLAVLVVKEVADGIWPAVIRKAITFRITDSEHGSNVFLSLTVFLYEVLGIFPSW